MSYLKLRWSDYSAQEEKVKKLNPEIGGEPIIGWRAWNVHEEDRSRKILEELLRTREFPEVMPELRTVKLSALTTGEIWPGNHVRMEARCGIKHPDIVSPKDDCGCGMYAWKDRSHAVGMIVGKVSLWGKIVEHKLGYRAQYAYPLELWSDFPEEESELLSKTYGVEVHRSGRDSDLVTFSSGNMLVTGANFQAPVLFTKCGSLTLVNCMFYEGAKGV